MREPKVEPASLPDKKDLVMLNKNKKIRKLYEQQAILYGVDILDDNLMAFFEAYGSADKEKKRTK